MALELKRLLAGVASAALLSTPALAQDATNKADDSVGLDEIVVTAQKRSENLQQVPITITAASGEDIAARGVNNTFELNAIAPGLNIRTASGAIQTFIRGIGTTSNVVENPVALYIDGVYLPQQRDGLRELVDVEQIAVLKGPQGTLFGRNATGAWSRSRRARRATNSAERRVRKSIPTRRCGPNCTPPVG